MDAPVIGKLAPSLAERLSKQLESRSDRHQLVQKAILKDPEANSSTIQDRSANLSGLLTNRPSRERLQRLNVIKEDDVSPILHAARDKLKKAQEKDKLESFLAKRPEHGMLRERRIIIDEQDAILSNRSRLEKLMENRPNRQSLIDQNIIKDVVNLKPQVEHEPYVMIPTPVQGLSGKTIVQAGVGWAYSAALDINGVMYTFGSSQNGRLGHGPSSEGTSEPKRVEGLRDHPISAFSAGVNHVAAISRDGKLFIWGEGQWGRMGLGDCDDRYVPTQVSHKEFNSGVSDVSCGAYHTLVLTKSGKVFSFGWNKFGRLGVGLIATVLTAVLPQEVTTLTDMKIKKICAGWVSSAAVSENGDLYTWGCGTYGVLGHGDEENQWVPKVVHALQGTLVSTIALGEYHALCTTRNGVVYSWGRNDYHQLGNSSPSISLPKIVQFPPNEEATSLISCGKQYSLAVSQSGHLYSWGNGASGVLGLGDIKTKDVPEQVSAAIADNVVAAYGGITHSAICTRKGDMCAFGSRGANGQLGQ